ncbi:MAG: GIY-YIG nuclease family protein [Bacteroidetes bacterium]|nr:GIY-YIG nuclease family protein [Bacteroidota bacterium]
MENLIVKQRSQSRSLTNPCSHKALGISKGFLLNAFLYILYSPTINKYYVGETKDLDQRLIEHRTRFF